MSELMHTGMHTHSKFTVQTGAVSEWADTGEYIDVDEHIRT